MSKTVKLILVIVVIVALVIVGSTFISDPTGQNSSGLQSVTTGGTAAPLTQSATTNASDVNTQQINREFVSMLLNLQSIGLNDDIFSEPAFQALRDNTIRLNQPGNEGRPNPFAPIGIDVSNTSSFSATSVEALQSSLSASAQSALETDLGIEGEDISVDTTADADVSDPVQTPAPETQPTGDSTDGLSDQQLEDIFSGLGAS